MIKRAWIVVCVIWTAFWVFLYILSAEGVSAAEQASLRANATFLMALPWIAGGLIFWIVAGRRKSQ